MKQQLLEGSLKDLIAFLKTLKSLSPIEEKQLILRIDKTESILRSIS